MLYSRIAFGADAAEGAVMNAFDRHLLSFVLTWVPFGGPCDEDTFPRFGLSAEATRKRFARIIVRAGARAEALAGEDAALMRRASQYLQESPAS